jgi:hypothetical protein
MKRPTFALFLAIAGLSLLVPATALAATPTFDQAIDQLMTQGYPQGVDAFIASLGTSDIGMRWAGSRADDAAAVYIAQQLHKMGLRNVHLERVPLDRFEFNGASVDAGGRHMVASSFVGVRPTPCKGLTGQVVYVHNGTAADYEGLDVRGKLVLCDTAIDSWWLNLQQAEATERGAKGVMFTYGPDSGTYYSYADDALGCFDMESDLRYVPVVYIAKEDGDWLKEHLDTQGHGPMATMKLREKVRMQGQGGFGFNVFGDLPGRVKDGTFTLFAGHHDGFFHTATDDTIGVTMGMTIAKAMKLSHYKPEHTVRFMFTTGEEFGTANSWWDWCIGSWWTITHRHRDWAGRIRGFLNNDYFQAHGSTLWMLTSADMRPELDARAKAADLPYSYELRKTSTAKDSWTFTAAGVPSVTFQASDGEDGVGAYHTQYMTQALLEWPYIAQVMKLEFGIQQDFTDAGLLPYSLEERADEVASKVSASDLTDVLADPARIARLQAAIDGFGAAAADYEAAKGSILAKHEAAVNAVLLRVEKLLNGNFTALTAWDTTCYPHEQVMWDLQYLESAIQELEAATSGDAVPGALDALGNVGVTWNGLYFSHDVYTFDLSRRLPTYYRANWGAQGQPIIYLDVIPQYRAIEDGSWTVTTVHELKAMRDRDIRDLNKRLDRMSCTLERATALVESIVK